MGLNVNSTNHQNNGNTGLHQTMVLYNKFWEVLITPTFLQRILFSELSNNYDS